MRAPLGGTTRVGLPTATLGPKHATACEIRKPGNNTMMRARGVKPGREVVLPKASPYLRVEYRWPKQTGHMGEHW